MNLLTSGGLNDYLADIEEQAQERFERIVDQMNQLIASFYFYNEIVEFD